MMRKILIMAIMALIIMTSTGSAMIPNIIDVNIADKVKYISQIQFHKNRHSLLPLVQLSYHTKFVRRQ